MPDENQEYDEEYQNLCNQKDANARDQASVQETINDLDDQIERLQRAYDDLDDAKEGLKDVRKAIKKLPNEYDDDWEGQVAQEVYDECREDGSIEYFYTRYIDEIDTIQDDLNLKLTDLENEKLRQNGILGELVAIGNSLWTRIQNWFN